MLVISRKLERTDQGSEWRKQRVIHEGNLCHRKCKLNTNIIFSLLRNFRATPMPYLNHETPTSNRAASLPASNETETTDRLARKKAHNSGNNTPQRTVRTRTQGINRSPLPPSEKGTQTGHQNWQCIAPKPPLPVSLLARPREALLLLPAAVFFSAAIPSERPPPRRIVVCQPPPSLSQPRETRDKQHRDRGPLVHSSSVSAPQQR